VRYVRFLAPPRSRSYGAWGAWAAPGLVLALRRLRRRFAFDLVHAHNAVPAGDAVRRARLHAPLVVSEHGADVLYTAPRYAAGRRATEATFAGARLVLANSAGIERACRELGARDTRVVRLGTDVPGNGRPGVSDDRLTRRALEPATIVTVGHLVARKRHADVLRALWLLRERAPDLRYVVVGDGPEREPLRRLAGELGVADRVELTGQLPHAEAVARARRCDVFVMPSVDEAFGVAYVEAMAAGVPAIGTRGEPGPEEIGREGPGLRLVPPGDVEALATEIEGMVADPAWRADLGAHARATVERSFTWARCGEETVRAYDDALR
jgi:teichuronic acid biosynthesis glycosyltransferase TuaC